METPLRHQRIVANAGSGKTYRLTLRYIELLARGVGPERIVALTFTRKSAGEFLDAIFARLLEASADPAAARRLAEKIGFPRLGPAEFDGFLRRLIADLPRLALGTLDGFFGRIVRVFPFECGIAGEIVVLDPGQQDAVRRRVLGAVFRSHAGDERAFRELLDLLREQSRNRQSRSVVATLDAEISSLHERFLLTPARRPWGEADLVWPDGMPFQLADNLPRLVDDFAGQFLALFPDMEEKHADAWEERFDGLRQLRPGGDVPEKLRKFALKAIDPPSKKPDTFELKVGPKPFHVPNFLRALVIAIGQGVIAIDLAGRLQRSRALYRLVEKFEDAYQQTVRGLGRLTFTDITGLLAANGRLWSGQSLSALTRQAIDYRLDATYDHWLLDEFQDTSRLQWQAIQGLVDEVVQSDSGRRSFFYVGDTKQAIYSWRGGDPKLFDEIADYYNESGEDRIDTRESLHVSYRSTPEVLEAVNEIFQPRNLSELAADLEFPGGVVGRWESAWRTHEPARPERDQGFVSWQTLAVEGAGGAAGILDEAAARQLQEIDPIARGWTCAVLVRSNARIASVVQALRSCGLPAAAEGRYFPLVDNEFGTAFLSLFRMLVHPGDSLSLAHVEMSPLRELLAGGHEEFRLSALRLLREEGLSGALRRWIGQLDLEGQPFLLNRAGHLLEAATAFDDGHGRQATLDEFVEYAERYTASESGDAGAIRVMTVHAAKGLDFDVVVLPEIEGSSLTTRRDEASIHLHLGENGAVQWGMEMPPRDLCAVDPILAEAYEEDAGEDCYEALCLYYVALTRAKRGLYLLSSRQGEKSKSHDFNRLLHLTLKLEDGAYHRGNPHWYLDTPAVPEVPASEEIAWPEAGAEVPLPRATRPSQGRTFSRPAVDFLRPAGKAEEGIRRHEELAAVEWDSGNLPSALRPLFEKPEEPHRLWIEKRFDLLLPEGGRVSGTFDRVVIFADRAELLDFKTGGAVPEVHRGQMLAYRRCLAVLTGLPEERIRARLVDLNGGTIIDVQ